MVAALYDKVGTYSRGPRKGLTKGYVHWTKCTVGGWYRPPLEGGYGRVIRPGTHNVRVHLTSDPNTGCLLDATANATDENRITAIDEAITRATSKRRYF